MRGGANVNSSLPNWWPALGEYGRGWQCWHLISACGSQGQSCHSVPMPAVSRSCCCLSDRRRRASRRLWRHARRGWKADRRTILASQQTRLSAIERDTHAILVGLRSPADLRTAIGGRLAPASASVSKYTLDTDPNHRSETGLKSSAVPASQLLKFRNANLDRLPSRDDGSADQVREGRFPRPIQANWQLRASRSSSRRGPARGRSFVQATDQEQREGTSV